MADSGYLFCLSNPCMSGLLLISFTNKNPLIASQELQGQGVPFPFQVEFAKKVAGPMEKTRMLHRLLEKYGSTRVASNRDFFQCGMDSVRDFLDLVDGEVWQVPEETTEGDPWQLLLTRVATLVKQEYPLESALRLGQTKMKVATFIKNKYGVNTNPTLDMIRESLSTDVIPV